MDNITKAEICEGIVDQLEKNGHCRGSYKNVEGQMCLYGAGNEYLKERLFNDQNPELYRAALGEDVIAEALGFKRREDVFVFNDGQPIIKERRIRSVVPRPFSMTWVDEIAVFDPDKPKLPAIAYDPPYEVREETVTEVVGVNGGLDKETAIEYATNMAKKWRNEG